MEFLEFRGILDKKISEIFKSHRLLYVTDIDKDEMWELYLNSFPEGTNKIYRERREYDCSCCRSFIKNFGHVVAIEDNKLVSIWDLVTNDTTFQPVADALSKYVKSKDVCNVFLTKEKSFGTSKNYEDLGDGKVQEWDHYFVTIPDAHIVRSSSSVDTAMAEIRSTKEVFKRSLEELSIDAVDTILELIAQNSLYKGEEWQAQLTKFRKLMKEYKSVEEKNNFCWDQASQVGAALGKIKNHSIGVLIADITSGMDLDIAVKRYESIVAPTNYKRPKAIFTKKMVEEAQKTIDELGLTNSLERKYASLEDITINNILFADRGAKKALAGSVFDDLKQEVAVNQKFDKLEEVSIDSFVKDILPSLTNIELFVENKHNGNLMSLISAKDLNSKSMFKWDNNFSWAYNGNITDSMKERVKAAGGKVDGVMRFSIQWNENGTNNNDLDAHCLEPTGHEIYFGNKHGSTGGILDVDIICPDKKQVAVENITWANKTKMMHGTYIFYVHNFSQRNGTDGFSAEFEYDGTIYSYEYRKPMRYNEKVVVVKVVVNDNGIKVIESIPSSVSSKKVWGVNTQNFQQVSVMMMSPNYWDGQIGIGNKHYFFILKDCINDTNPNGFFNEFLRDDLIKHKRVFEALGSKMKVEDSNNQLSGLGFSSTKKDSVICKVTGKFTRTIKINF